MAAQTLLDFTRTAGPEYRKPLDQERLSDQHATIRDFCLRGGWHTLGELEDALGYPQASISAQLRHLRKPRFGAYLVEKRRRGEGRAGLYEYRVTRGAA
jgi:hypothetical protein